jgi:rSAM/selenodomain-associated transferase 1
MHRNRLGIFARVPAAGRVKTRWTPPLSAGEAAELYRAFLGDLFERLAQSKVLPTVFYHGEDPDALAALMPRPWPMVAQSGANLGARMAAAFQHLLAEPGDRAVIIGSDSPDLPLPFLRRAFQRLKHRDVVIGPASDGGYYLIGLRAPAPRLFQNVTWGESTVLAQTIENIARNGRSLSLLPVWHDVDDAQSLELLRALCAARRRSGGVRLPRTERLLEVTAERAQVRDR